MKLSVLYVPNLSNVLPAKVEKGWFKYTRRNAVWEAKSQILHFPIGVFRGCSSDVVAICKQRTSSTSN